MRTPKTPIIPGVGGSGTAAIFAGAGADLVGVVRGQAGGSLTIHGREVRSTPC